MVKNKRNLFIFSFFLTAVFLQPVELYARQFKVATYNVENLFDLETSGNEYPEYAPNGIFNWNQKTFNIKIKNISKVLKDLNADIVILQEIESEKALLSLLKALKNNSVSYNYRFISSEKQNAIKCAVISKFPFKNTAEIRIKNKALRNILKTVIEVEDKQIVIYANHWKSKHGPEDMRVQAAEALQNDIKKLTPFTDYIVIGDFNSNYDEYLTFKNTAELNNTKGITGINHILKTISGSKPADQHTVSASETLKYNLWLELPPDQRWSYKFKNNNETPDSIIIGPGLFDNKGISYLDDSFNRFAPNYLFKNNRIFRWQRSQNGHGSHTGSGYSDHLPIYALFTTEPFVRKNINYTPLTENNTETLNINKASVAQLMNIKGIGKTLAMRIAVGRPYNNIEDLLRIEGIGQKKLNELRKYFKVSKTDK